MQQLRVVIVDDEPAVSGLISKRLSKDAPDFQITTLDSARDCLKYIEQNHVDCILTDYQMPEMSGMDMLIQLRKTGNTTPVIFITGQGNEEVAREAFKNGAYDYFTKDIGFAHFPRIVNSIEQAVMHRRAESSRAEAELALNDRNELLALISTVQSEFIEDTDPKELFDGLLDGLLKITGSEYGFIGEVFYESDGSPCLRTHAITNIAWSDETRAFYEKYALGGLEFCNLDTLFGRVLTTGEPVISNSPSADERSGGIPDGHPPLNAFMGLPIIRAGRLVGMAGIANRPGGYDEVLADDLVIMMSTCATMIEAYRSESDRKAVEERLKRSEASLAHAQRLARIGSWEYDTATDKLQVSDEVYRLLGYKPGAVELNLDRFIGFAHPDDRDALYSAIRGSLTDGAPFGIEHRIVLDDGRERIVHHKAGTVPGPKGRPVKMLGTLQDITSREEASQKTRRTLENIVESIKFGMIIVGHDRVVRHVNQAALEMMGLTDEREIVGRICHNNICPAEQGKCPILDLGQRVDLSEKFLLTSGGGKIPILKTVTPITVDGEELLMETFVDITAQKEAQEQAAIAKAFLQSVIDGTADPIMVINPDHAVTLMNDAARRLSQFPQGGLDGIKCYRLSHGADGPCSSEEGHECPLEQVLNTGRPTTVIHKHKGVGGREVWVEITASPMYDKDGRIISVIESSRDITDRKNMEQQRADFYAMVTHDLRGSLTTILGYSEILSSDKAAGMDEASRDMVSAIARSAARLSALVDSYLTYSKFEDGQARLNPVPTDVALLLEAASAEYSELAQKKGLSFETKVDEGLPRISIDTAYVQRAVSNLVENAINYTPAGGRITLGARREEDEGADSIVIFVSDTGPGIPEDEQAKVFNKYYRSASAAGTKGSGVGLAVVKAVMDAHGGRVELACPPGGGSTFRLVFGIPR